MGVLGVPLYPGGALRSIYRYLIRLSMENGRFTGSQCAQYGEPSYKTGPIRFFKFVWGLPAGTEDPNTEGVDNLPRYAG
jgi:hypothetical protein